MDTWKKETKDKDKVKEGMVTKQIAMCLLEAMKATIHSDLQFISQGVDADTPDKLWKKDIKWGCPHSEQIHIEIAGNLKQSMITIFSENDIQEAFIKTQEILDFMYFLSPNTQQTTLPTLIKYMREALSSQSQALQSAFIGKWAGGDGFKTWEDVKEFVEKWSTTLEQKPKPMAMTAIANTKMASSDTIEEDKSKRNKGQGTEATEKPREECNYCRKKDHYYKNCPMMADHKIKKIPLTGVEGSYFHYINTMKVAVKEGMQRFQSAAQEEEGSAFLVATNEDDKAQDKKQRRINALMAARNKPLLGILDSAATEHIFNRDAEAGLVNKDTSTHQAFRTANKDTMLQVKGRATLKAKWGGRTLAFKGKVAPELTTTLFSLAAFLEDGYNIRTTNQGHKCEVFAKNNPAKVKLAFFLHKGLFITILDMAIKSKARKNRKLPSFNSNHLSPTQGNDASSPQHQQQQQQPAPKQKQRQQPMERQEQQQPQPGKGQIIIQQEMITNAMRQRAKAEHNKRSWKKKRNKKLSAQK